MKVDLLVPEISKDSKVQVTVSTWFKNVGDHFECDEPLAELLFDKAAFDFCAPFDGKLEQILIADECTGKIGDVLAIAEDLS